MYLFGFLFCFGCCYFSTPWCRAFLLKCVVVCALDAEHDGQVESVGTDGDESQQHETARHGQQRGAHQRDQKHENGTEHGTGHLRALPHDQISHFELKQQQQQNKQNSITIKFHLNDNHLNKIEKWLNAYSLE